MTAKADELRLRASELTLGELLRRSAARAPEVVALAFGECRRTYGELDERVNRLAGALAERGIAGGDTVGVCLPNGLEVVETYFAAHRLGAVAVPLNFRLTGGDMAFIVENAAVEGVVVDAGVWESVGEQVPVAWRVLVGGDDSDYERALASQASGDRGRTVEDDAAAFVMYTSGTTGTPKGAVLTHKNLLVNALSWMLEMGVTEADSWTSPLPLFHIGGLVGLYPFLLIGAASTIQPTGGFDPDAALDAIDRSAATMCAYVPAQWQLILDRPEAERKLAGLRRAIWGAAPASRPLLERMVEILPDGSVVSTFGQTEVTANATFLKPEDAVRKLGSVGRPALMVEHRIVDDGRDVDAGEVGEIVYRGPTVMKEYLHDAKATDEAFTDGWFHSGDLVREDEEGYVYVVDRKKDMIISGGENVYPAEIERVLVEHPQVAEAAVVGAPDDRWGETPVAFVVAAGHDRPEAQALMEFCRDRLAGFKRPSAVRIVEELPRNPGGKVLKRLLRGQCVPKARETTRSS